MRKVKRTLSIEANSIAREHGHNKATEIRIGRKDRIVDYTVCGYRKKTTGEYVLKAYLRNFGWKNTYYQPASCIVEVNARFMWE